MGFLNYWRKREPEESQGELLKPEGDSTPVVNRAEPSRLSTYHRLHGELKSGEPVTAFMRKSTSSKILKFWAMTTGSSTKNSDSPPEIGQNFRRKPKKL